MIALKISKILFIAGLICFINSCGTLGGFEINEFAISKQQLEIKIDSFYKNHPEYQIPQKWKYLNDWSYRGYDFLASRIFYFKNSPEEMYYVTFIGDSASLKNSSSSKISIRAVNKGNPRWLKESDFNSKEKSRIENRFEEEIINKLK